jgi:MarR family transcriptional regulator, organic hydroperoxide resistance regulator
MDARKTETERGSATGAGYWPDELAGVDDASSALVFRAFLNTMRLHRQLMVRTLTAHGSHPGQAFCLRLLGTHDGATQRDMAETLHLARPTLSRMLRTMEKADMIERRPDATDQRLTRVYLTATGRDRERDLHAVASDYVKQTIGTLPEEDRRELARLLEAYARSIVAALAGPADQRTDAPAEATSAARPASVTEAAS